jgi:hypothetical protein
LIDRVQPGQNVADNKPGNEAKKTTREDSHIMLLSYVGTDFSN